MTNLSELSNTSRPKKARKRLGKGPGSKLGKTCGRGQKGAGSRSGYTRRLGYEGGQMRMHMKMPKRGFSNVRFQKRLEAVNLGIIQEHFEDGEEVSYETLFIKRLVRGNGYGVKILGDGELTKKVILLVDDISEVARQKLEKAGIEVR